MAEESWHTARLIPTSGIQGADEQEMRATSALLSVMSAVKEFNRTLLTPLGAPSGKIECFIEVPFDLDGREVRPDGLIRVTRGTRAWTALVEVKTGKNELVAPQLEAYLDIARANKFDALITISNEIAPNPLVHPTIGVDKRKLRGVALHHLSWSFILSQAVIQKEHRGVSDPDQAWILGELIRYLEHKQSGALDFDDMGADWVAVREAVNARTLRPNDKTIADVTARFDALLRFAALHLGRRLGTEVVHQLNRRETSDPTLRPTALKASLVESGTMVGSIRIPDTVSDLEVMVDLRASKVICHVDVDAPKVGKAQTRVNWIVRQLKDAPAGVWVESFAANQRGPGPAELLQAVRDNPAVLVADPKKDLRTFRIAMAFPMGTKRSGVRGAFIPSVVEGVNTFYEDVVQNLKPWAASPPKLRDEPAPPSDLPERLSSTGLSSQDDPEPADPPASHAEPAEPTPQPVSEPTSLSNPDVAPRPWWADPLN